MLRGGGLAPRRRLLTTWGGSFGAGVAEGSVASLGGVDAFHLFPLHVDILLNYHLGNSLAGSYGVGVFGKVDEDYTYVTSVVRIDSARGVDQGQSVLQCET